ncbi:hypothetical protein [Paenibacillus soyae]|uniref:DUF5808 domain-containing protein n=1 Tax=Paenibacillus soyae TaxID=2969249 RepID=A0A9X2MNE8_9BACL|nr:hypothetical protein [Paenibacillus soyae]MCR2803515.1 hypothetical protein [Paenibacillus soyae]
MAILVLFWSQSKPKKGLWFGVTLPEEALGDERLAALRKEFRKAYVWYGLGMLVSLVPLLALSDYFSLAYIYFFIWLAGVLYTSTVPFKRIHHKATVLKRDNGWFARGKRYVSVEKEIAFMSGLKPWSPYWFIVPALMCVPLLIFSLQHGHPLLRLTGAAALLMTGVTLLISLSFTHGKPRAYSRNAAPNLAIQQAARRYWSMFWLTLAIFEVMNATIAYNVLSEGTMIGLGMWLGGIAMVSLVPLFGIFYVHHLIKDLEYRYGDTDGKGYESDDDQHWRHGLYYHNPEDSSVWVMKRIGGGMTFNLATRAGKVMHYIVYAIIAVIVIPLTVILVRADSVPPELLVDDEGVVTIENSEYPYSFEVADIRELSLEDTVPTGFRTNGMATSTYARGNFKLTELDESAKLYVFKKSPPFIVMKLDELYIVYNDEDPEKTRALYEELAGRTGLAGK